MQGSGEGTNRSQPTVVRSVLMYTCWPPPTLLYVHVYLSPTCSTCCGCGRVAVELVCCAHVTREWCQGQGWCSLKTGRLLFKHWLCTDRVLTHARTYVRTCICTVCVCMVCYCSVPYSTIHSVIAHSLSVRVAQDCAVPVTLTSYIGDLSSSSLLWCVCVCACVPACVTTLCSLCTP